MPHSSRGKTLYPSKHRIAIRPRLEGFVWEILAPAPSTAVLATCLKAEPYTRARDAERQAEKFFIRHKVDFLLRERGKDFSLPLQSPSALATITCITPSSSK